MTHDDINKTAEEADRALRKLFLTLGVDLSDPKAVIAFQDDLRFLASWRESTQAVKRKALLTAVGIIVAGILCYLLLTLRAH
jgi:hypothetical protein